jgi:putative transposase
VDVHDVRFVHFKDTDTHAGHRLEWERAHGLTAPFSADAARHAKQVSIRSNRHVDPHQAVQDLLPQWTKGEVLTRRDRSLARRISSQRAHANPNDARASAMVDAARDVRGAALGRGPDRQAS